MNNMRDLSVIEDGNTVFCEENIANSSSIRSKGSKRITRSKKQATDVSVASLNEDEGSIHNKLESMNSLYIRTKKEETAITIKQEPLNISDKLPEKSTHGKKKVLFSSTIHVKEEGKGMHSSQEATSSSATISMKPEIATLSKKKVLNNSTVSVKEEEKAISADKEIKNTSAVRVKKEGKPLHSNKNTLKSSTTRAKKGEKGSSNEKKVANTLTEPLQWKCTTSKQSLAQKSYKTDEQNINTELTNLDKLTDNKTRNIEEAELIINFPKLENLTNNKNEVKGTNRRLRKGYRKLLIDLKESRNNIEIDKAQSIMDHVYIANKLYKTVNGAFEATLDSKVLVLASNLSVKVTKELKDKTKKFDFQLFKACILNKLRNGNDGDVEEEPKSEGEGEGEGKSSSKVSISKERWNKLSLVASRQIQQVGGLRILTGPLGIQQKPRARRSNRNKINITEEATIVSEATVDKNNDTDNSTTGNVVIVANILEKCGPTNLFKFVINPLSYGQTIENIFFLSFLIRDGKAKIETDEDNHPILTRCQPPTHEDYRNGLIKKQWFFEIDHLTWEVAIKLFDLKKPVIPHRNYKADTEESNPA